MAIREVRFIELLIAPDVLFRAAKTIGEAGIVERLTAASASRRRHRLWTWQTMPDAAVARAHPDNPQFVVNQPVIFRRALFRRSRPELFVDIDVGAVERAKIIGVLRLNHIAEIRFHPAWNDAGRRLAESAALRRN